MHRICIFIFGLIVFSCKNNRQADNLNLSDQKSNTELVSKIDAVIQDYIDLDIFSGIVLVAEKGNITYHKAFGLANRENNTPNTLNAIFDIGSMNKTFTSIVVRQLIAEGK